MMYEEVWIIITIFFWVLLAGALVLSAAWVYIQCMYYHWSKQDRMKDNLLHEVTQTINDKIDELRDLEEYENNC